MRKLLVSLLTRSSSGLSRLAESTARKAVALTVTEGTTDVEVNMGADGSALVRVFRRYEGERTLLGSIAVCEAEAALSPGTDTTVDHASSALVRGVVYVEEPIALEYR